ncbi:SH3 domain-containing protein [Candidatus Fermentibacterales bacterium]|nr:SH3 domain-containing protein [Candidatus Fermentibacterales bacterium]
MSGSVVNLRNGPGTRFGVVETAREGDTLEVLGEAGDWLRVYSSRRCCFGWIYSALTRKLEAAAPDVP